MAEAGDVENYKPSNRIKNLSDQASSVRVDLLIPAKRYFRSSLEMTRMAKVYYAEDNLESAFVLYQKFLWLVSNIIYNLGICSYHVHVLIVSNISE